MLADTREKALNHPLEHWRLGILLMLFAIPACKAEPPPQQILTLEPQQQAPGLCGVSCGEMVLRYYGIERVGKYRISDDSGGSALGQMLCDRLDAGTARTRKQPRCIDDDGEPILVYKNGHSTRRTREAFPKGTFLLNVQGLWREYGIESRYQRSVVTSDNASYIPEKVGPQFDAMLDKLRRGYPAIFHVTPRRKRGGGHYLLAIGYDDVTKQLHYLDPNPVGEDDYRGSVAYASIRSGSGWFRERHFFTGRYLAVTRSPARR